MTTQPRIPVRVLASEDRRVHIAVPFDAAIYGSRRDPKTGVTTSTGVYLDVDVATAERLAADLAIAATAARLGHAWDVAALDMDAGRALRLLADRMEGT